LSRSLLLDEDSQAKYLVNVLKAAGHNVLMVNEADITGFPMAKITIDIPDDLAQRLAPYQSQFSDLFTRLIATTLLSQQPPEQSPPTPTLPNTSSTYQEILDFLISQPTSEQIIGFKVSEASQSRLQTLLQKNREAVLTPAESAELDLYEQLDILMGLLKVRAYTTLNTAPQN
jgi:hypothetical protein